MLKKYLISSKPSYLQLRKHLPEFTLYRNKETSEYAFHAQNFIEMSKAFKEMKSFLHRDYNLAKKLGATGVHLTSSQFDSIVNAKELGLEVIVSTHTKEEVINAESLGADYVTYSPIFSTPNKGNPKGIEDLKELLNATNIKVFALGGIVDEEQINAVKETKTYGFASIRYFS